MRFSEVGKHDVVDVSEAVTVGHVEALVVEADPARIVALRLGKDDLISWSDLNAFGPDAVTVASAGALRAPDERERGLADPSRDLLGKLALSEGGNSLGEVLDVEFDPETGTVVTVRTKAGDFPGEHLTGLGTYAAILRTP